MNAFDKISDEEQALQAGKIDAAIHDQPALKEYTKQQTGTVKIVQNFNTGEQYGFGAAKGNTALIKVANYVIQKSKSDGTYQSSFEKWIGGTSRKLAAPGQRRRARGSPDRAPLRMSWTSSTARTAASPNRRWPVTSTGRESTMTTTVPTFEPVPARRHDQKRRTTLIRTDSIC